MKALVGVLIFLIQVGSFLFHYCWRSILEEVPALTVSISLELAFFGIAEILILLILIIVKGSLNLVVIGLLIFINLV